MPTGFSGRADRPANRADDRTLDPSLPLRDRDLDPWGDRLQLFVYLAPFVGFGPAAVDLLRGGSDRRRQAVARRSVGLAIIWLLGYGLLNLGSESNVPLLLMNGLWTSTYVLICVMGMVSRWRGTSIRLGPLGDWSETLGRTIARSPTQPPGDRPADRPADRPTDLPPENSPNR